MIVGGKGVGKYSFREQYVKGWIAPKDFEAPPVSNSKIEVIEDKKVEVTASFCSDLESPGESDFVGCNGVLILYNLSNKESFSYVKSKVFPILHQKFGKSTKKPQGASKTADETAQGKPEAENAAESPNGQPEDIALEIPLILVGNKADEAKLSRAVQTEEGENLSRELSCIGFFETSATCNENISKSVNCLVAEMLKRSLPANREGETDKVKPSNACCVIS